MIITREVQKRLEDFQPDYVFTYRDLNLPAETSESIIKMLNRLAGEGYLAKISKGRFYKPKKSVFGTLKPRQEELVKDLLEKNGKRIGYLTGYSVFNRLGLLHKCPTSSKSAQTNAGTRNNGIYSPSALSCNLTR